MEPSKTYQPILILRAGQVLIVAGIFWLAGFLWFLAMLPQSDLPEDGPAADGIVVLTGSPGRVQAGLESLARGKGKRLLISGVNRELASETILNAIGGDGSAQACCIDLGRKARDTHGNAIEAAEWAEKHNFNSLLVVTADYHLPRALIEFEREMPGVELLAHAVESDASILTMVSEFNKYLFSAAQSSLATGAEETGD